VKLRVVGCSPAWHNPGSAQSGYLVEEDGRMLLLDCGPGVLLRMREHEAWPHIDAIAITHFHLDHWGDLVPWAFGALFGAGRETPKPELWLPPGGPDTIRSLDPVLFSACVLDVFEVHEYAEGEPFEAAGFELVALRMPHYDVISYGFRVSANGSMLAYTGDSAPSPALAELGRDADLFVCEATLARPEPGLRGHLTLEEALEAYEASSARRFLVVHRPTELPVPDGVELAHDGMELEV
jgi:ribonuclease BN (tRNA processing enzyme)